MSAGQGRLDAETIRAGLTTQWLGKNVLYYPLTGSTNEVAWRLAKAGAMEGTLVIADEQSAGKGRGGRCWVAPSGSSLLCSLVFRPPIAPSEAARVTMVCGLAAADAVRDVAGVEAGLKWPNDLLARGRKLAGILTEISLQGDEIDFLVAGIGVNVNLDFESLYGARMSDDAWRQALKRDSSLRELGTLATSLSAEAGRPISRLRLLWRFLAYLEARYEALLRGHSPHTEWTGRMSLLGRRVCVDIGHERIVGVATGVDDDGALIVESDDATRHRILAGDVRLA